MTNETRQTLELAAQTESLLNLYIAAKLNTVLGNSPVKVEDFPIVQSVRAQIATVREIVRP